ncbi:hypothetical protein [Lichenicoccus sp.]|uniref:hypothetical protein n=1 Tax=Lichenicoccus sp. TaxID=2781899 RepID=UPI003D1325D8
MFGSTILDVLLAVVFTFLGVSLAASAITEAIAALLGLRQTTLLCGISRLLSDPDFDGMARAVYEHALVDPLACVRPPHGGRTANRPAFIHPRDFALALTDVLQARHTEHDLAGSIAALPDDRLRRVLQTLLRQASGDLGLFQGAMAAWFDGSMLRLSGWYRRRAQLIAFVAAFAVAAILNADVLHVTAEVWQRPALVNLLGASLGDASLGGDAVTLQNALARLERSSLIGWTDWATDPRNGWPGVLTMLSGWGVAAAAALVGAPFWFDTLQRLAWVRGGYPAPARLDTLPNTTSGTPHEARLLDTGAARPG